MGRRGVMEAGHAAKAALNEIVDGTLFAVVSGNGTAQIVYPYAHQGALAVMSSHTRSEAHRAVEGLRAQGGTAMGTWLTLARQIFETVPHVTKRHAILLTDADWAAGEDGDLDLLEDVLDEMPAEQLEALLGQAGASEGENH